MSEEIRYGGVSLDATNLLFRYLQNDAGNIPSEEADEMNYWLAKPRTNSSGAIDAVQLWVEQLARTFVASVQLSDSDRDRSQIARSMKAALRSLPEQDRRAQTDH